MQALDIIERFYAEDFIEEDYSDSNGSKWDLMQSIDMPKIGAPLVAAVEI